MKKNIQFHLDRAMPSAEIDNLAALAAGTLTIILFALTPTSTRVAITTIDGFTVGLMRTVGGGAIAIALIICFKIRPPQECREWCYVSIFSIGSFALFPSLFSVGAKWTSATHASLIMASMPLVTGSIGFMLDRRLPHPGWLFGAALALTGEIALIAFIKGGSLSGSSIGGDLVVLASCVSFCVGAVAGSRVAVRIGPWRSTFWAIGVASFALAPLAVVEFRTLPISTVTPVVWGALFHLTVGASVVACVAWAFALARGGISRVAPLQFVQPMLAVVFAVALLGEAITFGLIACGVVILVGVVIAWRNASIVGGTNKNAHRTSRLWRWFARTVASRFGESTLTLGPGVLLFAAASITPVCAGPESVDLLLVLAADVSYSISAEEYELQRAGYAAALTSPPVLSAIAGNFYGRIGICYIEWSGNAAQKVVVDWMVIEGLPSALSFADRVVTTPRSYSERTSISAAIDFSVERLKHAPFTSTRRVIDISGDGDNNAGRGVASARDEAVERGISINALVILDNDPIASAHTEPIGGLAEYYRQEVVGGPRSFVVVVNDFRSFGPALVKKLVTEISETSDGRYAETALSVR
jgi:drug/metabolite transporter (DMT)-like permease